MPYRRALGSAWRLAAIALGVGASLASSSSSQYQGGAHGPHAPDTYTPPPSQPMAPAEALGLWQTSFGPVKIERDTQDGSADRLVGVWLYERDGQEVIGLFEGGLDGNVLHFDWQEPAEPEVLTGQGWLVFEAGQGRFWGRWWTFDRSRSGDWTGERHTTGREPAAATEPDPTDPAPREPAEPAPADDPYYGSPPRTI